MKTRSAGQQLAERRRVRVDVGAPLGRGEVLQQPRLEPGVAVEHEHRQQPAGQLGHDDLRAAEVEVLGRALLADDARPRARRGVHSSASARV